MLYHHQNRIVVPALFVLLACLLVMPPVATQAALPPSLEASQFDWVCVTSADLVEVWVCLWPTASDF